MNLCKWSQDRLLMLFSVNKCKAMHIGKNNINTKYEINGKLLKKVTEERDLGVIMHNESKCSSHCNKAVKTAGMTQRTFSVKDKSILLQLNTSLVRPHLECSAQVWRLHF